MKTTHLWTTKVGSHVWQMNHAGSDEDLFSCYVVDTKSLLRGEVAGGNAHFSHGEETDLQNHEVQKWVEMLLKGNFNYLVGIFSPLRVGEFTGPWFDELQAIVRKNMAKNIAPSLAGMVMHNMKRYEPGGRGYETPELVQKKFRACARALQFGIKWMDGKGPVFEPFRDEISKEDILDMLADFTEAEMRSELPARPVEEPYRDYLYRVRMEYL